MKRYPVYKALYRPFFTLGVPLPMLIVELVLAAIFASLALFIAVVPVLIIHIVALVCIKMDPYILSILFDIATGKGDNR